ncbi:MAG: hypothetical protein NC299_12630 [Lachnospiraceae bacterium]|nr:hypothetical protein [Ruminococcus sp.]MCM1276186.1 hypothetical protein [Lachnospiraceae bacterium]
MLTEQELYDAIRECESSPVSYRNCEKLAVFYTLYDKLYGEPAETKTSRVAVQPVSDSEFMRLISGKDWSALLEILDELMDSIKILQPRLYDAVMRKLRE